MNALRAHMPEVHLLVLTQDSNRAQDFFGELIENGVCTVTSCSFDLVPDLLAAR